MIKLSFACDDIPQSERLRAVVKEFFEYENASNAPTKGAAVVAGMTDTQYLRNVKVFEYRYPKQHEDASEAV